MSGLFCLLGIIVWLLSFGLVWCLCTIARLTDDKALSEEDHLT